MGPYKIFLTFFAFTLDIYRFILIENQCKYYRNANTNYHIHNSAIFKSVFPMIQWDMHKHDRNSCLPAKCKETIQAIKPVDFFHPINYPCKYHSKCTWNQCCRYKFFVIHRLHIEIVKPITVCVNKPAEYNQSNGNSSCCQIIFSRFKF